MSKKMKIPSIFKNKEAKQPWQWPSCKNPKTISFRVTEDDVFKTINSVFLDEETPESLITTSSECASFSTYEISNNNPESSESVEMIIQGVRSSERLFFEPGNTSSILKEGIISDSKNEVLLPFKESVALSLESNNPYLDFKKSMQEMVESCGLKDWDCLEELLGCYLKMNGKMHHGFIVGAFVDLLVELTSNSSSPSTPICCSDSTKYSSVGSSLSSPSSPLSLTLVESISEIGVEHENRDLNIVQS